MFVLSNFQSIKINLAVIIPNELYLVFGIIKIIGYLYYIKSLIDSRKELDYFGIEFMRRLWKNKNSELKFEDKYGF